MAPIFGNSLQALVQLTAWWAPNVTTSSFNEVVKKCIESKAFRKFEVAPKFDVFCHKASVISLGIKKEPDGRVTIKDLACALGGLPEVKDLVLDKSGVHGQLKDLNYLSVLRNLRRIQLRNCSIQGDLSDIDTTKLKKLANLKLNGGGIGGSLHDLKKDFWERLEILELQNTVVTGNLSSDEDVPLNLNELRGLWLQQTKVTGDLMILLQKAPNLQYLHLPHTKVTGELDDRCGKKGFGRKLKELNLHHTRVTFNMKPARQEEAPLPRLSQLDVTAVNLSMNVWDFLYPLAKWGYYLSEVNADSCNLFGELQGISEAMNQPMYWQISVLGLSGNNITAIKGKPRWCWLDVSNNPHLKEIEIDYFSHVVLLDIRNTTYQMDKAGGTYLVFVGSGTLRYR